MLAVKVVAEVEVLVQHRVDLPVVVKPVKPELLVVVL
jgi:hypothetical protein